jgi:hypothetical protein
MASGGYRQPSSPAPVSGPGALSKRTDGPPGGGQQPVRVPTGGAYGEGKALQELQQAAPMAASEGGVGLLEQLGIQEGPGGGEPSQEPDTPVTAGAALGAGPGVEVLGLSDQRDEDMERLKAYLPVLEHLQGVPGSSRAARNLARWVRGQS